MSADIVRGEAKHVLSDGGHCGLDLDSYLGGSDSRESFLVVVSEDRPGRAEAGVGADASAY